MIRIQVFNVGKTKEAWLNTAIAEYSKRLRAEANIEFFPCKDDQQLIQRLEKESHYVCLDEKGEMPKSSVAFSQWLCKEIEQRGSRLNFVIGGPDGLPEVLRSNAPLLSLSPLTLTNQMIRLLLIEQIYRAFDIAKEGRYHRP